MRVEPLLVEDFLTLLDQPLNSSDPKLLLKLLELTGQLLTDYFGQDWGALIADALSEVYGKNKKLTEAVIFAAAFLAPYDATEDLMETLLEISFAHQAPEHDISDAAATISSFIYTYLRKFDRALITNLSQKRAAPDHDDWIWHIIGGRLILMLDHLSPVSLQLAAADWDRFNLHQRDLLIASFGTAAPPSRLLRLFRLQSEIDVQLIAWHIVQYSLEHSKLDPAVEGEYRAAVRASRIAHLLEEPI